MGIYAASVRSLTDYPLVVALAQYFAYLVLLHCFQQRAGQTLKDVQMFHCRFLPEASFHMSFFCPEITLIEFYGQLV